MPSLPGFQKQFDIDSGANADAIRTFIAIIYIGYGVGSALTFFINDRVGRIWSFRLYTLVYCIGTFMAIFSPNIKVLYGARIIQGLGLGAFTVSGPMSIVEIAPPQIRGLLVSWFSLFMGVGLVAAVFCTLGAYQHISVGKLQYQIVMFVPMIYLAVCMVATLFIEESPRWLFLVQRREEAIATLVRIRGLPANDPLVSREIQDIEDDIGMPGGSTQHGELSLDQLFFMRPVPGYADYRSPVAALYQCGASTHPGGAVSAVNGHNAAREILGDWKRL